MVPRLRSSVQLRRSPSGLVALDGATGLEIELEVADTSGNGSELAPEVWETLESLGLTDQGLSLTEILRRQRALRRPAVEAAQRARLLDMLQLALREVPYYRDRRAHYAPALDDLEAWSRLPLLRKPQLRASLLYDLVRDDVNVAAGLRDGKLQLLSTSGSTGERLQAISEGRSEIFPPDCESVWAMPPAGGELRLAVFTSPTCMGPVCQLESPTYDQRLDHDTLYLPSTADLFSLSPALIAQCAAELDRFAPHLLLANPLYLHWLARCAHDRQLRVPFPATVLSSYQLLPSASRVRIAQLTGAKVFDHYAATELGGAMAAVECRRGRQHVRADHCHIEVLAAPERPAEVGELGALALTTLSSPVAPLIRYLIGDVGRWVAEECDCELADWPVLRVEGRAKDMLRLGGRWVSPREVDDALSRVDGVDFYRCVQSGARAVTLEVIPVPGTSVDPRAAEDALRALGAHEIELRTGRRLEPLPSLKYQLTHCAFADAPEFPTQV